MIKLISFLFIIFYIINKQYIQKQMMWFQQVSKIIQQIYYLLQNVILYTVFSNISLDQFRSLQNFIQLIKLLLSRTQNMNIDSIFDSQINHSSLQNHLPIITTQFQLFFEGKIVQQIQAILYQKFIILQIKKQQKTINMQIKFEFSLVFEFLREKNAEKRKYNFSDVYSIKFSKNEKKFQLRYPKEKSHFAIWRSHLAKHLNQGGFHEIFQCQKEIGRGGFASVYLVKNNENGHHYAIKAFSKQALSAQENGFRGLVNEIEIMRAFNHQNLMKIYGVYESKNSLYICCELLAGGHLYDKIKGRHKFSSQEIRTIMKSILSGLETMHAAGYMHRDLKPENILFRDSNRFQCVIADFGLAELSSNKSMLFPRCGTPGYVAPQIANIKSDEVSYSCVCDLFSLGVIFHRMILGKLPFPGKTLDQVLEKNKNCKIKFDTFQYNQLPSTWLSLLSGLLEKDPKKRLTASQALSHQFFKKEPLISRNIQKTQKQNKQPISTINSSNCYEIPIKQKKTSIQCDSPLLVTKNSGRKVNGILKDDSCLKFKMREAVLVNRIQEQKQSKALKNPLEGERNNPKCTQSRFKQIAEHS